MYKPIQLVPPSKQKKVAYLKQVASDDEAREALFELLYLLLDHRDAPDCVVFISDLFEKFLAETKNDLNEERYNVRDLVSHLSFINKLKDRFNIFNNNAGFQKNCDLKMKREVDNE